MFSVITNIYNKKTKGPTLMELFRATGKLKKLFWQLQMFDVCITGDTAHTDAIFKFLPHMLWHGFASIFFTPAMIHPCHVARVEQILCTKCTLHSNHRLNCVIFQHTKWLLPQSGHFLTTYTRIARNVNCEEKQLAGEKLFQLFLLSVQVL